MTMCIALFAGYAEMMGPAIEQLRIDDPIRDNSKRQA